MQTSNRTPECPVEYYKNLYRLNEWQEEEALHWGPDLWALFEWESDCAHEWGYVQAASAYAARQSKRNR